MATHALYTRPDKMLIPAHSPFGRMKRKVITHLTAAFIEEPSPFAQTMIDGLSVNILIAKFFQAAFLRGEKLPPSVLRDYTGLWNSISRDLSTLAQMAKDSGAKDPVPSLEDYLKRASRALPAVIQVEAEPSPNPEPAPEKEKVRLF